MKFRTEIDIINSENKISVNDKIFSIGSCFATEIHNIFILTLYYLNFSLNLTVFISFSQILPYVLVVNPLISQENSHSFFSLLLRKIKLCYFYLLLS